MYVVVMEQNRITIRQINCFCNRNFTVKVNDPKSNFSLWPRLFYIKKNVWPSNAKTT